MTKESILPIIGKNFDSREKGLVSTIERITNLLINSGNELTKHNEELRSLWYNSKTNNIKIKPKEFGYWASTNGGQLLVLMERLGIKSILDLGCGCGYMLKAMKSMSPNINLYGYDNEKVLVDIAAYGDENNKFLLKNIINLLKKDLPKENCIIYWWEPIIDKELSKQFIDNLCNISKRGQLFIFMSASYSSAHMRDNNEVEVLYDVANPTKGGYYYPFSIYIKK